MIIAGRYKIRISIYFVAVLPLVAITGSYFHYAAAFISIMLHEFAHMASAAFLHCKTDSICILPLGLSAEIDLERCDRKKRLIIYSCGPFMSLFLSMAAYIAGSVFWQSKNCFYYIALLNFYLAVFNMIPAIPLDGGRILQEILNKGVGMIRAARYIRFTALFLSAGAIAAGICLVFAGSMNPGLFLMGLYFIIIFN